MDEIEQLKETITQLESENATYKSDIEKLKTTVTEKESKITELQSYICKNLTTPREPQKGVDDVVDFADAYRKTLSEIFKKV